MVLIAITPMYAENFVISTLVVKFLKYQVITPNTAMMNHRAYHSAGYSATSMPIGHF
jgi:hypothetical protein